MVVVELYLTLYRLIFVRDAREIEDALEVKRIVNIQVDPEERVVKVGKYLVIEVFIFLGSAFRGILQPERRDVVDRFRFFLFIIITIRIAVLGAVGKVYLDGHKGAVAVKDRADLVNVKVFLLVLGDMHYHIGAAALALTGGKLVFAGIVAVPVYRGRTVEGTRFDLDAVADHKCRVESESEVTYDTRRCGVLLVFVLLNEVESARERDAAKVFFKLFGAHSDAVVGYLERSRLAVDPDIDAVGSIGLLRVPERDKALSLRHRISRV